MRDSTARREALVGPIGVGLIALSFAVVFAILKPSPDAFSIGAPSDAETAEDVDELDMAYLRVRRSSGMLSNEDVARAVEPLLRARHRPELRALLQDYPDVSPTDREREWLDLQRIDDELLDALGRDADDAVRQRLLVRLDERLRASRWPDVAVAELTALASTLLAGGQAELASRVFARLADLDGPRRQHWLTEAVRWSEAAGNLDTALAYQETLIAHAEGGDASALEHRLIELLMAAGRTERAVERLEALLRRAPLDAEARRRLARAAE